MTNINNFSTMLNSYSEKVSPEKRKAFKADIIKATSDADGLTVNEIKAIAEKYLSAGDRKSFSEGVKDFIGTKFVTQVKGVISSQDSQLMAALGEAATSDRVVTPEEAKTAITSSIRKGTPLAPKVKEKLEEIAGGSSDFAIVDSTKSSITKVTRLNLNNESVSNEGDKPLNDVKSLQNLLVMGGTSKDASSSQKLSGETASTTALVNSTQVSDLPTDSVIPTTTIEVNIPIERGQTPEDAILAYLKEHASEKGVLIQSEVTKEKSKGGMAVSTTSVAKTTADTMETREKEKYTTPIPELGNITRDALTKSVFPNAGSDKKWGIYVQGIKSGQVTPEGKQFIEAGIKFGLIDKTSPITPKTFVDLCEKIGLKNDMTGFKIGAQYITQMQQAVVAKAGTLIDKINSASDILKNGKVDEKALELFRSAHSSEPPDSPANKFIAEVDSFRKGDKLSISEEALSEFQEPIKAELRTLHESLNPNVTSFANHPILQALRSEIDPSKLVGKTSIIKPTQDSLISLIKEKSSSNTSIIVQSSNLRVENNNVVGTITLGAMQKK